MKIGISVTSAYQTKDVREGAAQMIARAREAADAGLDSLFVGDHHTMPTPYYQNTPMIGRMLAEWDHRPAGALYLLPLWNPVLAAEQIATLSCIAKGPFIMQCGLGQGRYQFNAMGANIRYRPSAFEQSIEVLRALWRGETVSLNGRWQFENANISPVPPEKIDIWIGASAPVAIDRAARLGEVWLAEPGMTIDKAEQSLGVYRDALGRHGKSDPTTIAIRRDIYVAESDQDADSVKQYVSEKGYRGFDPSALVIGDAASVAGQLHAIVELGYTDIIIRNLHPNGEKAIASTQRLRQVRQNLGLSV